MSNLNGSSPAPPLAASSTEDDEIRAFQENSGLRTSSEAPDINRPWMKGHQFELVRSADEFDRIVDAAIASGACALDLETEGLDNRIFYNEAGKPYTKHSIVGYCLSYDGVTGYYAPVGHRPSGEPCKLNLPLDRAQATITRLCDAAQPKRSPSATDLLSFREWAQPPQLVIYFWNAKFDQEFLYPITNIDWWHPDSFEDGNLAYYTYYSDDKQLSLKWKAFNELRDGDKNPYEMIELKDLFVRGMKIDFASLYPDDLGCKKYACSDAICTFLLCRPPRPTDVRKDIIAICKEKHGFTYRLEKQTAQADRWMERCRVRVNRDRIAEEMKNNIPKRDELLDDIKKLASSKGFSSFDPKSTKVLSEFLFGKDGLNITVPDSKDWPDGKPPLNEKSKQYKTDADTLERLVEDHPEAVPDILKLIVEWRGYEKLDSTYLQNLHKNVDDNSEMRFQFKQTGAATGRFSAPAGEPEQGYSGIPIHGIPTSSSLRRCFEARDGYTLCKCDYAGQELRIAANLSGEPVWIREFLEGDGDLHTITARAFFPDFASESPARQKELRKYGKTANFALLYGGGPQSIIRATGCDKLEATRRKRAFDEAVPKFAAWIKSQHAKVRKDKGVYTAFARWIAIPDIDNIDKGIVAACERKAINFPVQGTGADIMKIALVTLAKELFKRGWLKQGDGDDSVRMLLTVHDEIVFEIKHHRLQEALPVIIAQMALPTKMAGPPHSPRWLVPLVVEPLLGQNWAGEHDYGMLMHGRLSVPGEKLKEIEKPFGDRVYHKTPFWLEGIFKPGYETQAGPDMEAAAPVNIPPVPPPPSTSATTVVTANAPAVSKLNGSSVNVAVFMLPILNRQTVDQVRAAAAWAHDPDNGKILCLVAAGLDLDKIDRVIIEPELNIRVNVDKFGAALRFLNLGTGAVFAYPSN